jgi:hypothetical protein
MGPHASLQRKAAAKDESVNPIAESQSRQELRVVRHAIDALGSTFQSSVLSTSSRAAAYLAKLGQIAIGSVRTTSIQSLSRHIILSQHGTPNTLSAGEAYGVALQVRKALHEVLSERPNDVELRSNRYDVTFPASNLSRAELALFYANDRHVSILKRGQKVFKVSLLSLLMLKRLGMPHAVLPHGS